mmetsp:Transcript_104883/g.293985  ORF Transcript_104883/g.293985 Transcript_104883/m.293985 type:complete len:202 (+) Transcript_104883:1121-1726(+)
MLILWSSKVPRMASALPWSRDNHSASSASLRTTPLDSSINCALLTFVASHHSNLDARLFRTSRTSKATSMSLTVERNCFCFPPPWCCSKRSTNSRRRSLMPAFAPDSLTSGLKFSSNFSISASAAEVNFERKGNANACLAVRRRSSFLSSIPRMKASPWAPTRLGALTVLFLTSSSPLKGKRPVAMPYTVTPRAQMSTGNA